nr:zinc finger, CCHC-type, retrotransposon Gag domain protein [Tanacetum cinerariifolium]
QTSSLKPYVPNVILEKIIIDLEDEVVNILEKEKVNLETIKSLKSKSFESSEKVSFESENKSENDCLVVEKEYDKEEIPKVIAPWMFKLSMSQCVSPVSISKSSCDSNNVKIKLKRKRRKKKSSKQNVKQVDNDVSRANSDFVHFLDLDTFSSVKRPKNSSVIWKKKWSSNTSNVSLSAVSVSNLKKNVKRYSRKDLLACNNSHLGETSRVIGWCVLYTPSHGADPSTYFIIRGLPEGYVIPQTHKRWDGKIKMKMQGEERLKREYHSICQMDIETSTEFMQHFLRLAGFLGAAAGTAEEQAKNFQWGLRKST